MDRFGSVLAILGEGGAESDLHAAATAIARVDRAALTFVDVIADAPIALSDREIAARRAGLVEAVARAEFAGIAASEALLHGDPAVEVIRMVLREGHDLVLVGEGSGAEMAARLLADCPSPVWRVGSPSPAGVVAVMPDGGGPDAARVAAMAEALSRSLGGVVTETVAGDAADRVTAQRDGAVLVVLARDLALAGEGSVLAIKPEGFVSPVTLDAAPQGKDARRAKRGAGKG
ncbi:hypothetical protein [Roseicyclus marinus]|uniref:hypothetical protein n=1 Tax=Roseicyclus marinus TaxID=2161673 RepID=UPI00241068EA|nr:hypothetical protein [Roseicyclus marinus]MDG3040970.1 hypothetical protein [Roseicyclus marinus]